MMFKPSQRKATIHWPESKRLVNAPTSCRRIRQALPLAVIHHSLLYRFLLYYSSLSLNNQSPKEIFFYLFYSQKRGSVLMNAASHCIILSFIVIAVCRCIRTVIICISAVFLGISRCCLFFGRFIRQLIFFLTLIAGQFIIERIGDQLRKLFRTFRRWMRAIFIQLFWMLCNETVPIDKVEIVFLALISIALQHGIHAVLPLTRHLRVHQEHFAIP